MKKLFFVFFFLVGVLSAQTLENVKYNTTNGKVGTTNGGTTTNGKPLDLPANTTLNGGPIGGSSATGTVTDVSVTPNAGVTGVVTNSTTTPAIKLTLGDIVPTHVNNVALTSVSPVTLTLTANATLSGTNTGDQTSVTGNAGTATKLATARTINTVPFDGTANIVVAAAGSTLTDGVPNNRGGLPTGGSDGQVLTKVGTNPYNSTWAAPTGGTGGGGDVTAAVAFGTDNRLIRSDGIGKGVQASGITISDTNDISGVGTATSTDLSTTTFTILDDVDQAFGLEIHEGTNLAANQKVTFFGAFNAIMRFTAPVDVTFPPSGVLATVGGSSTLPTGGAAGQVLAKIDGTNYNTNWVAPATGGTTSPGGISTQVQYNDAGVFNGDSSLTINKASHSVAVTKITGGGTVPIGGTTNQVLSKIDGTNYNVQWSTPATGGSGSPGGSSTQVQFNDAGAFAGSANLTFDKATGTLHAVTLTGNGAVPSTGLTGQFLQKSTDNPYDLTWGTPAGGGSTVPGGANTQLQFNDSGAFGGDTGLTYNKTTDVLLFGTLADTGLARSGSAGVLELNNGTVGQYRDLRARNISIMTGGRITGGGAVPPAGLTDQVLAKVDGTDYNLKWVTPATGGASTPGGSSTQVQFNDAGAFAGSASLTYNKATGALSAISFAGNGVVPGSPAGLTGQFLQKATDNPYDLVWATPIPAATPKVSKVIWLTTAGSGTFTVDSGCRALYVEVMGGGGGSAGALGTGSSAAVAGGGGGGSFAAKYYATPAVSYAYTVGAGGSAGAATPTAGGNGADTTFGTAPILTGAGGNGSAIPVAGTGIGSSGGGGNGQGSFATSNGDVFTLGGNGSLGIRLAATGGYGGFGGASVFSTAAPPNAAAQVNTAGGVGNTYGGGAGGAASATATGQAGAAGGAGAIKITEFF